MASESVLYTYTSVIQVPSQPHRETAPTAGGKLEGQDAAFVKVQLVFLGLRHMQNLHITAFHPNC